MSLWLGLNAHWSVTATVTARKSLSISPAHARQFVRRTTNRNALFQIPVTSGHGTQHRFTAMDTGRASWQLPTLPMRHRPERQHRYSRRSIRIT